LEERWQRRSGLFWEKHSVGLSWCRCYGGVRVDISSGSLLSLTAVSGSPTTAILSAQLSQLRAGFDQLDTLRSEEGELAAACEQVALEESRILADSDATEAQSVKRLVECRAKKDIRNQRLITHRKRIAGCVDVVMFDIGQLLRRNLSNLAYALLRARQDRIQKLFDSTLGNAADHGLPVTTQDLTQRSRPVLALQGLYNSIGRDGHKDPADELAELRSEVPRRWQSELRAVIEVESKA